MKLLYLTAIKYPSTTASAHQIKSMSEAFQKILGNNFLLLIDKSENQLLEGLKFYEMKCPFLRFRTFYYLYRFLTGKVPFLDLDKETIIYTKDPQLIFIANLFKKKYKYKTCFELHIPWKSKIKFIVWRTDSFVVLNKYLRDLLIRKYKIEEERVLVFPDAVDLEEFNIKETKELCRKRLCLPLDKKIVLYTGHLFAWRGAETLARSTRYLDKNIKVGFVGGTKGDIERFRDFVRKERLKNIKALGRKEHSKIPFYLKGADALILPNTGKEKISRYWTSPLKMFEYMAAKKPIVASDLPSIREILNEKNAILVKPDNPQALARGIKKVLNKPDLAKRISNQAHEDVQAYTWDKRAKKIIGFLRKSLIR